MAFYNHFDGTFVELFGPVFWRRIDPPKVDAGPVMKSSSSRGLPVVPYRHAGTATPRSHEPDVGVVILIIRERALPTISALRYTAWYSRSYRSCRAGHDLKIPRLLAEITKCVWFPRNQRKSRDYLSPFRTPFLNSDYVVTITVACDSTHAPWRRSCHGMSSGTKSHSST